MTSKAPGEMSSEVHGIGRPRRKAVEEDIRQYKGVGDAKYMDPRRSVTGRKSEIYSLGGAKPKMGVRDVKVRGCQGSRAPRRASRMPAGVTGKTRVARRNFRQG